MEPSGFAQTVGLITGFLAGVPWYVYFLLLIVYGIATGKRKEWEYEAKLVPEGTEMVDGEIEIKKYKNEPPIGEIDLRMNATPLVETIEVLVEGEMISKFQIVDQETRLKILFPQVSHKGQLVSEMHRKPSQIKANKYIFPLEEHYRGKHNQTVEIRCAGVTLYKGILVVD